MSRPKTSPNSFKHPRYSRGRVYIVGNTLYVEMPPRNKHRNPIRVSTGLYAKTQRGKIIQENLDAALEILRLANWVYDNIELPANAPYRELLRAFGATPVVATSSPLNITLERAWKSFTEMQYPGKAQQTQNSYEFAKAKYFPEDLNLPPTLPGTIEDVEALAKYIGVRRNAVGLATNTTALYEGHLDAFFKFCVTRQYMPANPFNYIVRSEMVIEPGDPFTIEEILALDRFYCELAGGDGVFRVGHDFKPRPYKYVMMRMLIRLIFLAAPRISEAVAIHRTWFTDKHIGLLKVKGMGRGKKPRFIPHGIIPGTRDVADDILYISRGTEYVFPWPNKDVSSNIFELAVKEFNIPDGKRFHSIRSAAINYWRDELAIPEEIRNYMAGHSQEVARDAYMVPPTLQTYLSLTQEPAKRIREPIFKRLFVE